MVDNINKDNIAYVRGYARGILRIYMEQFVLNSNSFNLFDKLRPWCVLFQLLQLHDLF